MAALDGSRREERGKGGRVEKADGGDKSNIYVNTRPSRPRA